MNTHVLTVTLKFPTMEWFKIIFPLTVSGGGGGGKKKKKQELQKKVYTEMISFDFPPF